MSRVLLCDHPEADFSMALTVMGLRDLLGPENVVDFPVKGSYRGRVDCYKLPPQQVWNVDGTISAGPPKDGVTAPFAWMRPAGSREWSLDEVVGRISEFSLVVASVRPFALAALAEIDSRRAIPRLVLVDGEDSSSIKTELIRQFGPRAYFKRHLVREEHWRRGLTDVLPLPFSVANIRERSASDVADTDVCLLGGSNAPGGKAQYEGAIRRVTSNCMFGQLDYGGMLGAVSRSRIAVAPAGHGQDSLRSWEFLGVEGPLVAIQRHELVTVDPLMEGQHVAWFSSPKELEDIVRGYLAEEDLRACVAAQGFAFAREKHTALARAAYLMEKAGC